VRIDDQSVQWHVLPFVRWSDDMQSFRTSDRPGAENAQANPNERFFFYDWTR
jgi:hypothetical protein